MKRGRDHDRAAPLEPLFESPGLPATELPEPLARLYGGPLGFDEPRVVANFVQTLDGVVAIPSLPRANRVIGGDSAEDRFVMGLLRAFADAVVLGSGTLAGSPKGLWTPEAAHPPAAEAFAQLRRRLGKPPVPELAVLTATGSVNPRHRAVEAGALVVTTDAGAARLAGTLPGASEVVSLGPDPHLDPRAALDLLRGRGHRLILSEAGPHLFGSLLRERLVDELFLTLSPLLAGRAGLDGRLSLVEEAHLVPDAALGGTLLSVRRSASHLFLRYAL
jgi:riboflavin biosynthesis pyrimidine reductase